MPTCSVLERPQWQLTEYCVGMWWEERRKPIEIIYLICGNVTWDTRINTDTWT